ncbi:HK97-gp10 family putative phage morphogenesis protein [Massilia sp. TS11]|uniref:HK97-gp10 family putative phage morphogenesis protein n=1 Tax=Massilia sp. TS11 TaxID=2908003 RepID=UPI001EDAC2F7|nr:HK97-gp10 family putative phage morphogenesis protein [Massilia sp. TS11]MCG2586493.1 HK97 gp10 family phage protein [Massilia sp. TS11]
MSNVKVKGLSELQKFLDQLPAKVEKNMLRSGLRAGANVIKDAAGEELESNGSVVTGSLKKGLKVSTSSRKGVVKAKVKTTGPHAHLGPWIEHGTKPHLIKPKAAKALAIKGSLVEVIHHPGAKPKPFMRPALDSRATEALQAVGDAIKARLTKQGLDTSAIDIEVEG